MDGAGISRARVWYAGRAGEDVEPASLKEVWESEHEAIWAELVNPSEDDLRLLASHFGIGETVVEDALAPHERAKVTRHDSYMFFTVYATSMPDRTMEEHRDGHSHLDVERISGILFGGGLITIRLTDGEQGGFDMDEVLRRWEDSRSLLEEGSAGLVHGLLDYVVDCHFDTIQRIDDALEDLEGTLFEEKRTGPGFLRTTYALRKDLVSLRRVVLPMREVLNALMRQRGRSGGPLDAWYDDLYDHVLRASEWTESLRDMVTTVFETNLSLQDARLNTIMKKLAGWAAIIAVPTAVTGWFGQNVPYPGFDKAIGLWYSVIAIVVLSVGLYVVFRRRDWL